MATVWAFIKMLTEWWAALKALLGLIERAKHEHANEEIKENTDKLRPEVSEEERLRALKELQDRLNSRT